MKNLITLIFLILCANMQLIANAQKVDDTPIKNFGKVNDCYYRGGQPGENGFEFLSKLGIKTIINLREPFNFNKEGMLKQKALANSLGMNYINIPMNPTTPPDPDKINLFFNVVNDPKNLPVFVHCNEGKDRTGIMTALYRVRDNRWNYDQAYWEMREYGYHRFLYPEQKHFLADYIQSLNSGIYTANQPANLR